MPFRMRARRLLPDPTHQLSVCGYGSGWGTGCAYALHHSWLFTFCYDV